MKRKDFLKLTGTVATGLALSGNTLTAVASPYSGLMTVLRGGKTFYQNKWQTLDIGIDASGKLKIGVLNSLTAPEVIDTTGKIVSPGFIDILADNTANPEKTYTIFEKYKVADGVTTALQMHGGSPDTAEYYRKFGAVPHAINYGVSTFVMRVRYRTNSLTERKKQVEKCLEEGALGVSHSIEYQPTPYEEVMEYAKLAKKYDRPLFLHLRYSSSADELNGVEEAIRLARESGARVHIDHLHSTGGTFHMEEALRKIKSANAQDVKMTCCVYPYSFWATYLHSTRFGDGWQQRYGITYNDLRLVGTGERLTKESFAKYKEMRKLVAVPEGILPLDKTVDLALKEDFCMIGSDGGIEYAAQANSHPRGAGCFSTSIRHCLDIGMPLEKALDKVTTMQHHLISPALKDRGIIADGAWADLTVFDSTRIKARATVENPNQFSDGIDVVYVNGKVAFKNGNLLNSNGVGIKY